VVLRVHRIRRNAAMRAVRVNVRIPWCCSNRQRDLVLRPGAMPSNGQRAPEGEQHGQHYQQQDAKRFHGR
jgi:hypothetical protein